MRLLTPMNSRWKIGEVTEFNGKSSERTRTPVRPTGSGLRRIVDPSQFAVGHLTYLTSKAPVRAVSADEEPTEIPNVPVGICQLWVVLSQIESGWSSPRGSMVSFTQDEWPGLRPTRSKAVSRLDGSPAEAGMVR